MQKFTIEVPSVLAVTSRGQSVEVKVADLTPELMAKLAMHGLTQKVADAAAGAKKVSDESDVSIEEATLSLMQKVVDRLHDGDWGVERGGGAAADPLDKYRIEVLRDIMRSPAGEKIKTKHDAIDGTKERRDFLLAVAAKNADKIDPEAQRRFDVAKAAAKNAKGLDLDI